MRTIFYINYLKDVFLYYIILQFSSETFIDFIPNYNEIKGYNTTNSQNVVNEPNNEINNFIPNYNEIKANNTANSQSVVNPLNNEYNNLKNKIGQLNTELKSEKDKNQNIIV